MASLHSSPLHAVLSPYAKDYYTRLFERGDYILFDPESRSFSVIKTPPKDPIAYFANLSRIIVEESDSPDLQAINLGALITRVNICYTRALRLSSTIETTEPLFFNSRSIEGGFLSNFFPSLVLFPDHRTPDFSRVYPSSESAYQAHKINFFITKDKTSSRYDVSATGYTEEDLFELQLMVAKADPCEAKKLAPPLGEADDDLAVAKANLMKEVLQAKFKYNPEIQKLLSATKGRHLVEDSSDRFWGAKNPKEKSLSASYSNPICKDSLNVLGRLLMEIRSS